MQDHLIKVAILELEIRRSDSRYNVSARISARASGNSILPPSIAVNIAATRRLQCTHIMFLWRHSIFAIFFGKAFKKFTRAGALRVN
jgi:hypothetical protein